MWKIDTPVNAFMLEVKDMYWRELERMHLEFVQSLIHYGLYILTACVNTENIYITKYRIKFIFFLFTISTNSKIIFIKNSDR